MKTKAAENVQVSLEIQKQMFKGVKLDPWHATMMVLHMAHYKRLSCALGQAYVSSSCELSGRQQYDRKLGRAKTWLIKSQSQISVMTFPVSAIL